MSGQKRRNIVSGARAYRVLIGPDVQSLVRLGYTCQIPPATWTAARTVSHGASVGSLGFISSNTFFKTGSGKPLREYLLREATIEGVVDFGDLQIFEGVTTYPAILTMKRGAAPKSHELHFWKVDALPEANFQATWEAAAGPYPQAALGAGSWELENSRLQALRAKIEQGKPKLQDIYGAPLYGIKTGLNEAFVIDTATKDKLCAVDPRSAELLKPFLEGKDIRRWRAEPRGLWGIMLTKGWTKGRYGPGDEEEQWKHLSSEFPGIAGWISQFARVC